MFRCALRENIQTENVSKTGSIFFSSLEKEKKITDKILC